MGGGPALRAHLLGLLRAQLTPPAFRLRRLCAGAWRDAATGAIIERMRVLYHLPLSPFARKVRLVLAEKRLAFDLRVEKPWERRPEYLTLNPAGTVPTLVEDNGLVIPDSAVICEYLDEAYPDVALMGGTLAERVEVRRLTAWFDGKFAIEVTQNLLGEKHMRRMAGRGNPDPGAIRTGYAGLRYHLEYLGWLAETRRWLAGAHLSVADFAAAAQLSALDFIGDVDWSVSGAARDWYARMKSRPSFRGVLGDRMPGMAPPAHYDDLDF
jgi:glutathione S-transferase